MARIANSRKGREDGGYTRLFGNAELGALISRVHSTSISAGNELEKLIQNHSRLITPTEIAQLFDGTLRDDTYLVPKGLIKKYITAQIGLTEKKIEPDFLLLVVKSKTCFVIELKDGDSFDTKKAAGEVANLRAFRDALGRKLPYPWVVHCRVCMFNQSDKEAIVRGFKEAVTTKEAMTGEELCKLLSISYSTLVAQRAADQRPNMAYFVKQLLAISEVKALALTELGVSQDEGLPV